MSNSDTITIHTTKPRGGSVGETFCDTLLIGDIASAAIRKIRTWGSASIYGLEVQYTWGGQQESTPVQHGSQQDPVRTIYLGEKEFITGVQGFSTGDYISRLIFVTNDGRSLPVGAAACNTIGEYFEWGDCSTERGTQETGMRLLAFSGRIIGGNLGTLQGIFFDPRESSIHSTPSSRTAANYEEINVISTPAGSTVPFSKFTSHLLAPVITLYIGPNRLELHAHQDTLCKLPFFGAALQGSFSESLTKTIAMPEDGPSMVSALIEYLYTGNYTYTYNSGSSQLHEALGTPVATLTEGQYHVGVVGIASKYDCQELVTMAARNFEAVLPELDSIDRLRLWTTAYSAGAELDVLTKSFERCHPGNPVRSWVKELFKKHREEIDKTIVEFPEFASELLRLASCGDD